MSTEVDPFAWLNEAPLAQDLVPAATLKPSAPPALYVENVPGWAEFIAVARRLLPEQRVLLEAMGRCGFNADAARRLVKTERGASISRQRADRWLCDPLFLEARKRLEDFAIVRAGLSASAVLARLDAISIAASQMIECTDEKGNKYQRPVDARTAVATLKLLGEYRQLWERDTSRDKAAPPGPGLSITFIHNEAAPQTRRTGTIVDGEAISIPTPKSST